MIDGRLVRCQSRELQASARSRTPAPWLKGETIEVTVCVEEAQREDELRYGLCFGIGSNAASRCP
jgi:hypothetical protein